MTRLDSLQSKLEQLVDAFIRARKELEEILVRKYFSLVLNLWNRRKCLCLHLISRLRDDGFITPWIFTSDMAFPFGVAACRAVCFFFFLISNSVCYLFSCALLGGFVLFLWSPWFCILISQQRAAVNKDICSLDLLTWRQIWHRELSKNAKPLLNMNIRKYGQYWGRIRIHITGCEIDSTG